MKLPLKTFRLHWATFSFLHILKYFLLGKKSKGNVVPFVSFSVVVSLKPSNFFCVLTSLRCVLPFLFPHPLPLFDWLADQFLCSRTSVVWLCHYIAFWKVCCPSYGLLSKHLIFFFLVISRLSALNQFDLEKKDQNNMNVLQWNLPVKNFYVLLYHYSCLILHSVKWHNHRLLWF